MSPISTHTGARSQPAAHELAKELAVFDEKTSMQMLEGFVEGQRTSAVFETEGLTAAELGTLA